MKSLVTLLTYTIQNRTGRRNTILLLRFVAVFAVLVTIFTIVFHLLMAAEGREYSWTTGFYWTLTVMSTLGFGDITFHSDVGRLFSILVLLSGIIFLLVLLPFTFIEFFYAPWMSAQRAARAPRRLPKAIRGHVILTHLDPVVEALVPKLEQYGYTYALIVPELEKALRLHDEGFHVLYGSLDDPETFRRCRAEAAALVVATGDDPQNTSVAFTVREQSANVPILTTASSGQSVDILELAGSSRVLRLGQMLGQSLARRTIAGDAMAHVIGQFGDLLIAEATAAGTPIVGRSLVKCRLRENVGVTVAGIWERGKFVTPKPDTVIGPHTVIILAGSQDQIDRYNELFCIYHHSEKPVVIIGGGRSGRATGRALAERGIDYRIVEKQVDRLRDQEHYVNGDAASLEVLKSAGIMEAPAVVITPHEDEVNIYLTIYCRRLRPDIQIITRATFERNVSSLHRAGADFVMSYASMGANWIMNVLKHSDILMLAEGLDVFRVPIPAALEGRTLINSGVREKSDCSVLAVIQSGGLEINPPPDTVLEGDAQLVLIGDVEAEKRFLKEFRVKARTDEGNRPAELVERTAT